MLGASLPAWPADHIYATLSRDSGTGNERGKPAKPSRESRGGGILQTPSAVSSLAILARAFPPPWSAYVCLVAVKNEAAEHWTQPDENPPAGASWA